MTDMPDTTPTSDPSHDAPAEHADDAAGYYTPGEPIADTKAPAARSSERWNTRKFEARLVNPANRRKLSVIIVGTGLAGASAAATLGEAGYVVKSFCYQDSPRRAHSIAAQGGINAAKNYKEDGDSVHRLFYDTVKGGDYRSRESNVYRLAEVSTNIIDQCVAQGVPFAREYGGLLDNRSFGGVQVSRTFYARGQTGQQLLIGAYQALERQVAAGTVTTYTRHEMLELIVVDGKARGIIARDMVTGEIETHLADVVVLASGGYGNVFYLSTNAMGSQRHRDVARAPQGRLHGQPLLHADPPDLHPGLRRAPVEADADVGVAAQRRPDLGAEEAVRLRQGPARHPRGGPRLLPGADLPVVRQPGPPRHRLPRRQERVRRGPRRRPRGRTASAAASTSTSPTRSSAWAATAIEEKYGNLFDMYARITGEDPYEVADADLPRRALRHGRPVGRLRPAVHDPRPVRDRRGQLLRPRRQPPRRLGADAGPGRRLLRAAAHHPRLPRRRPVREDRRGPPGGRRGARRRSRTRIDHFLTINGTRSVDSYHRELGNIMWEYCGMERTEDGPEEGDRPDPRRCKDDFWRNVKVLGTAESLNQSLEKAGRVADFFELGELMCIDALNRRESCGGHFRAESQTEDGEALRHDDEFAYVAAWEFARRRRASPSCTRKTSSTRPSR